MTKYLVLCSLLWLTPAESHAASIQLEDRTTFTGDVLQLDDDHIVLRLPRKTIATVDGEALPPPLVEGVQAPAFAVRDILGQRRTLGQGEGRLTLLHFWVSWCPHCRADAPKIQALHDQWRDNPNVQILTVNLDEERAALDQFLAEHKVSYPVINALEQAAAKDGADLAELYHISAFPVTYLIDAQGTIRRKVNGSFVETGVDLDAFVKELLPNRDSKKSPPS